MGEIWGRYGGDMGVKGEHDHTAQVAQHLAGAGRRARAQGQAQGRAQA